MEDRENKETILSSCHEHYWQESGTLHVVNTVCGSMGGQRSECYAPDYIQEVQRRRFPGRSGSGEIL